MNSFGVCGTRRGSALLGFAATLHGLWLTPR
jgi:hypothetical protein